MQTKLILVEGLPGFGKSTTARLIQEILTDMNVETELFLEGNLDHPADYDSVACFTEQEYMDLLVSSGEDSEIVTERVRKQGDNYFIPYQKIKNEIGSSFLEELFTTITKNDIYELPLDQHMELMIDKWKEFATEAVNSDNVYIFECCFIQNPVTVGMVKHGVSNEKVLEYVAQLSSIVTPLQPLLVYVEQEDLSLSFNKAVREREKEWSEGFVHYYTTQGYGKNHQYTGIDGTLKVLEARKELEKGIFDMLNMKKVKVDNSRYERENYKLALTNVLTKE